MFLLGVSPSYQERLAYLHNLGGGFVVTEFGEVVAAECEFQKECFVGGSLSSPPKKRNERDKRSVLSRSEDAVLASNAIASTASRAVA